jgi:hypothetical protein
MADSERITAPGIPRSERDRANGARAADVHEQPPGGSVQLTRAQILDILSDTIGGLSYKLRSGRVRDVQHERLRAELARVTAYACSIYSAILKDGAVEEIEKRLEALERVIGGGKKK